MDGLLSKINSEVISALKEKDVVRVSTLRLLLSSAKNRQIELGKELSEDEVLEVIAKSSKQHKESIAAYEAGGRQDLVDREKKELAILEKFLPEQMSEEEITTVVVEIIGQTGVSGAADTGKVIGAVMAKIKGKADGNIVSRIVREKLA
jgi:hypothetical protein